MQCLVVCMNVRVQRVQRHDHRLDYKEILHLHMQYIIK